MALKNDIATTESSKPATEPVAVVEDSIDLELALYTNYLMGGHLYTKGTAEAPNVYRFKREDAMFLLAERDCNRPVWKLHQKTRVKARAKSYIDATKVIVPSPVEPIHGVDPNKRIDVGDESELSDILDKGDDVTL